MSKIFNKLCEKTVCKEKKCSKSDKIRSVLNKRIDNLGTVVAQTTDKVIPDNFKKRLEYASTYLLTEEQQQKELEDNDAYLWKRFWHGITKKTSDPILDIDPLLDSDLYSKTLEPFESTIDTPEGIKKAAKSRHDTFAEKSNFQRECGNNADATSDKILQMEKNDLDKLKTYFESYLKSYKSLFDYKSSLTAILNSKKTELEGVNNKIDTYKQNLFIDSRKDTYTRENYEFYKNIYFFVMILFYSLLVLYLIFSDFIPEKKYFNLNYILLLIVYLFLPIILRYTLAYIHKAYIYLLEYHNIREEVISYPYIIEDKYEYDQIN